VRGLALVDTGVMTEYRAELDAEVSFSNGGKLATEGFRIDLPGKETGEDEVVGLFLAALGLLMAERVELRRLTVFAETHKGTRGGPSDQHPQGPPEGERRFRLVELSHVITAGMTTYPGLPGPEIVAHLSREASRAMYSQGTEFAIDKISLVGNTGTYLDSPFHRYAGATDLAGLALSSFAELDAVVVRTLGSHNREVGPGALSSYDVDGRAVLLHTGGDEHWGTPRYAEDAPYLSEPGARWLVEHGARLVGIDSVNIDDIGATHRPAHSILLAAGIPVVEHLTGLGSLPVSGAVFTAAPARIAGFGTFPVRAYATVFAR
jgi:kynurenine formamidase